jgi:hypothetical protein
MQAHLSNPLAEAAELENSAVFLSRIGNVHSASSLEAIQAANAAAKGKETGANA